MSFELPWALGLWPLLPLTILIALLRRERALPKTFLSPLPAVQKIVRQHMRRKLLGVLLAAALLSTLLTLLAAQPYRDEASVERKKPGIDIVLAWDLSESMEAEDYYPNRLSVSRRVIHEFIQKREADRIGLVVFAGEAVTKCPLTQDYAFLHRQVDDARLRELKQGTAIGMALATSVARLRHSNARSRVIILLTDGDSNVGTINPMTAAYLAEEEGIRIYAIGIGKEDRVIVPIYSYDSKGQRGPLLAQVPSYLNPELLEKIAKTTGGKAFMARDTEALARVLGEIDKLERTIAQSSVSYKRYYLVDHLGIPTVLFLIAFLGYFLTRLWWRSYGTAV